MAHVEEAALRRTPDSTIPVRRSGVTAAALFGYLWLAQVSAFGAATEPSQSRAGEWGVAMLAMGAGIVFGRKRLYPRALTASVADCVNISQGLAGAFSRIREELTGAERGDRPTLRVRCVGDRKQLDPSIEGEIYEIGREALRNAIRHAHAESIEVALTFRSDSLHVVVRDDGCGFKPEVVAGHPETYRGLAAMRDGAERIGGRLRLRSAPRRGTELELRVPMASAANHRKNVPTGERACCVAN